ncbi:G-protein coupled receptor 4-like [Notolabrus celidotus]|uniref:G-protein coupled receptor 4-like n=1 Tax=Notolabrus celidotus TaxID=1203425 RepID=UPI0014902ED2|nr:G-protein coupled receptor 4-like [Notolabrus celidotus]XP_034537309.1 G-protein coupled receptor 4-like [Notolabrus celidotus]
MEAGFNNTTYNTDYYDDRNLTGLQDDVGMYYIEYVVMCIVISIGLPLVLVTIYALSSLVRQGQVAPIYVINLLISDIIQLCCMIALVSNHETLMAVNVYNSSLLSSVGFMVCISLERYLVIVHPLWYRFKRTIKISIAVCAVVWAFPLVYFLFVFPWVTYTVGVIVLPIILIIPFPLFIFFLVRTLRALSSTASVRSDEKRRIVGTLVVVLLIYTLLFLPIIIRFLLEATGFYSSMFHYTSGIFVRLSPPADLLLYIFIRKQTMGNCLASVCGCIKESNDPTTSAVTVDDI